MRDPDFIAPPGDAALARAVAAAGPGIATEAEAELCRRFAPRIRLYGLRHLRDPHAAGDLVQSVLVMLLERLRDGKVRDPERLASFVLGMCRMVVLDLRRGSARRERLLEQYYEAAESVDAEDGNRLEEQRLAGCLQHLSERERLVLVLTFYADKSAREVARELALSEPNVRVIRHRALHRLRACVTGGGRRA
jgi:RNA polymerase sigma-70 factor, ECF subfamily